MATPPNPSRVDPAFAAYVASCQFFDAEGMLDLERFCVHLRLCLYCDGAPAPDPGAIYAAMLGRIARARASLERRHVRKTPVADWNDGLGAYYPDRQRTLVHFEALAIVYPAWIGEVGDDLLGTAAGHHRGRAWVLPGWTFSSRYLGRFEAELVRVAGLARLLDNDQPRH